MKSYKVKYSSKTKHKVCIKCNIEKPVSEFYLGKSRRIGLYYHSYCKECNKKDKLQREKNNKIKSIEYMGGKCKICGYKKYYGALDFHHLNPEEKDFTLSKRATKNFEKQIKKELDKCIMLCSNCHRELHGGLIKIDKMGNPIK